MLASRTTVKSLFFRSAQCSSKRAFVAHNARCSSGLTSWGIGFSRLQHENTQLNSRMWFSDEKKGDDDKLPENDDGDDYDGDMEYEPNEGKHSLESLDGDPESFTVAITVNMPDMTEGNDNKIEKWYKQPGDVIKKNDILCDIATPEFTFGMVTEDEFDAIMGEIHVAEAEAADDNDPICTIYHQEEPGSS